MGLGCSEFARHYYRNRGFFLFLQVLRWFTSLSSLLPTYEFSRGYYGFTVVGFPIRTSPDQMPACGFPRLIAACHVLHRFLLPRHPPCALSSLTIKFIQRWNLPVSEQPCCETCHSRARGLRLGRLRENSNEEKSYGP